ncbi:MAG: cobalamin biosynthesis protein CobG [Paracoccaceae bacterium]|nr:cobalamin biosynthesis protein CobG [Paracoccaceae bacterium]
MNNTSAVKGWCPGAYRPMMSGDGLIVRVRPFFARLDSAQVFGLCALSQEFGNGFLDLTNRANIQIRGVQQARLDNLLSALADLNLLDDQAETESRRNIVITPFWAMGDDTVSLCRDLMNTLSQLPELPAKFGFSIEACEAPLLTQTSGDIRIERGCDGLIVRAQGAARGRAVTRDTAVSAVHDMAQWFAAHRTPEQRRMADVVAARDLPADWTAIAPLEPANPLVPGPCQQGFLLGAAFGQLDSAELANLMQQTGAPALRITPWRLFLLEGVASLDTTTFVTKPDDPLLHVDACPGAPFCASATVPTRDLARDLATRSNGSLHISGCAKGCARKSEANTTFVGNQGRFDLVSNGHAWDAPEKTGLTPDDLKAELTGQR